MNECSTVPEDRDPEENHGWETDTVAELETDSWLVVDL